VPVIGALIIGKSTPNRVQRRVVSMVDLQEIG
jgi:hypothetical protein